MEIDLRNGAKWEFPLEMVDDVGPVVMTGRALEFEIFDRSNTLIGFAATTGATGGTLTINGSTVDVLIPAAVRPALAINGPFLIAYGDLFDISVAEREWLGRAEFRILSGPTP